MHSLPSQRLTSCRQLAAALLIGTALAGAVTALPAQAQSSPAQADQVNFAIAPQALASALTQFGQQAGVQVSVEAGDVAGITTSGLEGAYSVPLALQTLLSGTGLDYTLAGPRTVIISRIGDATLGDASSGSIVLGTVDVNGWFAETGLTRETVYETGAAVSHVDSEDIDHFRGSSPANMFSGVPGVSSGDARNGAGSIDVNIRGMQGFGRVNVTIDGAENGVTVYQGYQGVTNRTFVDPDLIKSVDIVRGSDAASRGIAGSVSLRTIDAEDIVADGKVFGAQIKTSLGTNTSTPVAGARAGYSMSNVLEGYPIVTETATGMDRPGWLLPTQGSGSFAAAIKTTDFDVVIAAAHRQRGNYHAGTNGRAANPVFLGETPFCYPDGSCPYSYYDYVQNDGLANYRPGEEVLNTQTRTSSILAKTTYRFGDGHTIKLGYSGYLGETSDVLASSLGSEMSRATQAAMTTGIDLRTYTLNHKWDPAGNDLINLTNNVWLSTLAQRHAIRLKNWSTPTSYFGLPDNYRVGSDTFAWGADTTNKSFIPLDGLGDLTLTYGASFKSEDLSPSAYTRELDLIIPRDGSRQEAAVFAKAAWDINDWVTLNGGLRYQHYWSQDRSIVQGYVYEESHGQTLEASGFSPSIGVTVAPMDGVQLFANYAQAQRMPSMFESTTGFSTWFNPDLKPERSSNWDIGANFVYDNLVQPGDTTRLKLSYFNWEVSDYLARQYTTLTPPIGTAFQTMYVYNIDRARFSGLELAGTYENANGLRADLSANYYLNVEFCKTVGTCEDKSLYADFATNQIPPLFTIDLTLSQKLLDDRLTVGGRISYVGPRAIGHGEETARGQSSFINLVEWDQFTTVDLFADYKVTDDITAGIRVENVTDTYYVDPLGNVQQPAPGRTIWGTLTARF